MVAHVDRVFPLADVACDLLGYPGCLRSKKVRVRALQLLDMATLIGPEGINAVNVMFFRTPLRVLEWDGLLGFREAGALGVGSGHERWPGQQSDSMDPGCLVCVGCPLKYISSWLSALSNVQTPPKPERTRGISSERSVRSETFLVDSKHSPRLKDYPCARCHCCRYQGP